MNYIDRQLAVQSPHKEDRAFKVSDFFMVVLCLFIAAVCVYYFYLSLTQTLTSNLDPVGSVTIKYNSVQRRMGDRVLWDRVYNESPLYPGDIIRVADYSGATLNFANNRIDLQDNTLIRVILDRLGQPQIELSGGTLNFASDEDSEYISLVIGGRLVEAVKNTVFSVTDTEQGMVLKVTEGNATITDDSGESLEVIGGTMIALENEQSLDIALVEELVIIHEPVAEDIEQEVIEEPVIVNEPEPTPIPPPPPALQAPPPLASPEKMQPENGYTINAAQFKGLKSIDFSWAAVNGANAYILTVFHETADGRRQIIQTDPFSSANWYFKDLNLLDRGAFVWQVEAVNRNAQGVIQRRGNTGESTFIIDVPIPRVQLEETRNLYE